MDALQIITTWKNKLVELDTFLREHYDKLSESDKLYVIYNVTKLIRDHNLKILKANKKPLN